MKLAVMRFAGEELAHNPKTLRIERRRSVNNEYLLGGGCMTGSCNENPVEISGTGELYGDDCFDRFNHLVSVYRGGKPYVLALPGFGAVRAVLSKLDLSAEPKDGVIAFSFVFTEYFDGKAARKISPESVYIAKEGESLWDIAYKNDISIEELLSLNTWIRNPWVIEKGSEVRLI